MVPGDFTATANNHAFDYVVEGMQSILCALDEAGLVHTGTGTILLSHAPLRFSIRGRGALRWARSPLPSPKEALPASSDGSNHPY